VAIFIQRPVTVKAKVTEVLKKQLAAEFQEALRRTEAELAQIEGQLKRLGEADEGSPAERRSAVERLQAERQNRLENKSRLVEKLKESGRLEPGVEVGQGTVEGFVQVRIGDDWDRLFQAEIVVEDGRVVAIRE
jgi:septal ring factor EnvC (AmiA/AmiB activator)